MRPCNTEFAGTATRFFRAFNLIKFSFGNEVNTANENLLFSRAAVHFRHLLGALTRVQMFLRVDFHLA